MNLRFETVTVNPVNSVRNLGVILDSELTMNPHISKISSICFFHLRHPRKVRNVLDTVELQHIVSALIISHIQNCNAVFTGLLSMTLLHLFNVSRMAASCGASCLSFASRCMHSSTIRAWIIWLTLPRRFLDYLTTSTCAQPHLGSMTFLRHVPASDIEHSPFQDHGSGTLFHLKNRPLLRDQVFNEL